MIHLTITYFKGKLLYFTNNDNSCVLQTFCFKCPILYWYTFILYSIICNVLEHKQLWVIEKFWKHIWIQRTKIHRKQAFLFMGQKPCWPVLWDGCYFEMICRSVRMDFIFEQGPNCQKIFKSSISGLTPADSYDRFCTCSRAPNQTLDLMLWDCPPFLVQCCWQFCKRLDWRISLTYAFIQNVLHVLNWIDVGTSCWTRNGSDCILL